MCREVWLIIHGAEQDVSFHRIAEGTHIVGRSHVCDIHIGHPSIAPAHAELVVAKTKVTVRDLSSATGTFLNGARVTRAPLKLVKLGDELSLGSVRITVTDKATAMCRVATEEAEHTSASEPVPIAMQPAKSKEVDGKLSPAQHRVFVLLLEGLPIRHVARRLKRDFTVQNHCKAIYRSLGVQSRPELLATYLPTIRPEGGNGAPP